MSLRSKLLHLASTEPKGSNLRKAILATILDTDDTAQTDWSSMLRLLKQKQEIPDPTPDTQFNVHLAILKNLQTGDRVEITYNDPQRGGLVKTQRTVQSSWSLLQEEHPGSFNKPQVILAPKVPGKFKAGTLRVGWDTIALTWQATLSAPVKKVVDLRKI